MSRDGVSPARASPSVKDREVERTTVYLHAGELFVSIEPCEISTIVGSCVAVCILDRTLRIGGANHYLLPTVMDGANATPRFGNVAILELIARLVALGASRKDLVAKVFGGASLLPTAAGTPSQSLGWKNVRVARRVLAEQAIPVVAEDVGGGSGRKLVFRTDEGHVFVKRV